MSGNDNVAVKPLVKHVLSKELQLYFEKICSAVLDEGNNEYRVAALASIASDPGLHQLVPYFVQFIAEKVTHSLKNIFTLTQMMELTHAMLDNKSLHVDPYVPFPLQSTNPAKTITDRIPNPPHPNLPRRPPPRRHRRTNLLLPPSPLRLPPLINHKTVL